jgi:hypothetical protein
VFFFCVFGLTDRDKMNGVGWVLWSRNVHKMAIIKLFDFFFCAVCMAAILFEDVWSGGGDTRSSKSTQKKEIKNIYKTQELLIAV